VLADPAYGNDTSFRHAIAKLGLSYVLGIQSTTTVCSHCPHLNTQAAAGQPIACAAMRNMHRYHKQLAFNLPAKAWKTDVAHTSSPALSLPPYAFALHIATTNSNNRESSSGS
jgi:SRSO17 transposase